MGGIWGVTISHHVLPIVSRWKTDVKFRCSFFPCLISNSGRSAIEINPSIPDTLLYFRYGSMLLLGLIQLFTLTSENYLNAINSSRIAC